MKYGTCELLQVPSFREGLEGAVVGSFDFGWEAAAGKLL
jgi:hypothetical protein